MLRLATVLVVALLAGCTAGPLGATPPTAPTADATFGVMTLSVDGYWPIPTEGARDLATRSGWGAAELGAIIQGEAALRSSSAALAGDILAYDAEAARLLNASQPPAKGEVLLSSAASAALGAQPGSELELVAASWPSSKVLAALEMERVRPCDARAPSPLCSLPTNDEGEATLILRLPPGASDLRFHADVVELSSADFPAYWNGTFASPTGAVTPFHTAAYDRGTADPPGEIAGDVESGEWTIKFTLDAGHRRAPGAIAGFITYTARGFSPFDVMTLRIRDAAEQTRAHLANATVERATLRVSGISDARGAVAILSLDDARDLLRLGPGNVTALVAPGRTSTLSDVAPTMQDPALGNLRARNLDDVLPPAPATGGLLFWAPPDVDLAALPRVEGAFSVALTVEAAAPLGALGVRDARVSGDARLLALSSQGQPWTLHPGALWPDEPAARHGIAQGPHLVLLSDDMLVERGISPTNATYVNVQMETGLGTRTLFGMGGVAGGPSLTVWGSAALVSASSATKGARIAVALAEGADREAVEREALSAWARHGVVPLAR